MIICSIVPINWSQSKHHEGCCNDGEASSLYSTSILASLRWPIIFSVSSLRWLFIYTILSCVMENFMWFRVREMLGGFSGTCRPSPTFSPSYKHSPREQGRTQTKISVGTHSMSGGNYSVKSIFFSSPYFFNYERITLKFKNVLI